MRSLALILLVLAIVGLFASAVDYIGFTICAACIVLVSVGVAVSISFLWVVFDLFKRTPLWQAGAVLSVSMILLGAFYGGVIHPLLVAEAVSSWRG